MKKFFFRLEPLLKMRVEKEEEAFRAQVIAQQEHFYQRSVLDTLCKSLDQAREASVERILAGEFLDRYLYIESLAASKAKQEKVVEETLQELEHKRQAVVEARKEKLVLQKLKERSLEKYREELNRWEIKIIDDQCTVLTHRKSGIGD